MRHDDEFKLLDHLLEAEAEMPVGKEPKFIGLYILEGHEPVGIADTLEWARWFEKASNRRLAQDEINGWRVSTVFLGIDNAACYLLGGIPDLFETMVFSTTEFLDTPMLKHRYAKSLDTLTRRYKSWDEAIAGHQEACHLIREGAI